MKQSVLEKLDTNFTEFPFMRSESVPMSEVDAAEITLGLTFISDFREFITRYGGAMVGPFPIYGLRHASPMDEKYWSVVDVTMRFRNQGWISEDTAYIISTDHSDNPVGIISNGTVVSYDHDYGESVVIAPSFEEYLVQCLSA